jgi:transcriptional regulator
METADTKKKYFQNDVDTRQMSRATTNSRHFQILELVLRGVPDKDIIKTLGVSTSMLSVLKRSASFQHELSRRRAVIEEMSNRQIVDAQSEVSLAIKEGTRSAIKRLLGCINSDDESIALRASTEVLDRGGHPRVQRNENKNVSVSLAPEDAKLIAETLNMVAL